MFTKNLPPVAMLETVFLGCNIPEIVNICNFSVVVMEMDYVHVTKTSTISFIFKSLYALTM